MTPRPGYVRQEPLAITTRQLDYLRLAAAGATCKETAKALVVSIEAVKTARREILARLGARNMAHAVAIAYKEGLLP